MIEIEFLNKQTITCNKHAQRKLTLCTHSFLKQYTESFYSSATDSPPPQPAYLNAETLQMLDGPLESVQKRKQHAGSIIADAIQRQMVILMEQLDPEEAARQLFGVGIINVNDMENATNRWDLFITTSTIS